MTPVADLGIGKVPAFEQCIARVIDIVLVNADDPDIRARLFRVELA